MSVSISAISRISNVVTVATGSAHGLVASQGFSITGTTGGTTTFNINATIVSVADSTHFTFNQTGANESATGGTAAAAKQIIVLETAVQAYNLVQIHYLTWITTTKPHSLGSASSAWSGATPAENAAIASGTTIEINSIKQLPSSLSTVNLETILQAEYSGAQAYLQSLGTQPGQYEGSYFDGTWH